MISLAGCVAAHTAGCRPVVPSSWEEGLGVVEKNNVRHICFICCDRVCSATTPHPSSPEEGTTLGVDNAGARLPSFGGAGEVPPPPFTGGVGGWVFRRCSRPAAGRQL